MFNLRTSIRPIYFMLVSFIFGCLIDTASADDDFTVRFDTPTGRYVFNYSDFKGQPVQAFFEPSNRLNGIASPTIQLDPISGAFDYQYTVLNASNSAQDLFAFGLELTTGSVLKSAAPNGWQFKQSRVESAIFWIVFGARLKNTALPPGSSLGNFSVRSSLLPDTVTARLEGLPSKGNLSFIDEPPPGLEAFVAKIENNPDNQYFRFTSIGPNRSAVGAKTTDLVGNLISLKHQSVSLSWLFGPGVDGIVNSLDAKLSAARDAVSRGDNTAAANQLNAFINELDAQRGKHLNDNAYFLLRANAQFIISKLGSP